MANLFDAKYGKVLAFIGQLSEGLSPETVEAIMQDKTGAYARVMAQAAEKYREPLNVIAITVPHLTASALVAQAQERLNLTYCNPDLKSWNFVTDECGKTYEVLTHRFGHAVGSETVRSFFRERGFKGNTAAFVAWVTEKNPEGYHASIPEDGQLRPYPESRGLYTPYFYRGGSHRKLYLHVVRDVWGGHWVFVAFRELPQST